MVSGNIPDWLGCPICHGHLNHQHPNQLICPADDLVFPIDNGIIQLLPPDTQSAAQVFTTDYDERRHTQGWYRLKAEEMAALPADPPHGWEPLYWQMRHQSFQRLDKLINDQHADRSEPLRIVDMGAGIGWLAHLLAQQGHEVVALDLSDSDTFGLSAARRLREHSGRGFTLTQGMLEHPPLQRAQVDTLIFNASLHYVNGVSEYLRRCLDFLSPTGQIIILDSPVAKHYRTRNPNWHGGQHLTSIDFTIDAEIAVYRMWRGPRWWWRVLRGIARGDVFSLPLIMIRRRPSSRD